MRNRISLLQFMVTPEFEANYRKANPEVGEEKILAGLAELR